MNHFHIVGSLATSVILINLMWCNIFSVQPFEEYKPFKHALERFGNLGVIILVAGIAQWFIVLGIASAMFPEIKGNPMKMAEGGWTILCYSWYGFTIVGAHISPHLWPWMNSKIKSQFWLWVSYIGVCIIFGVGFTVCLYLMWVEFLDPVFVQGVLGVDGHLVHDYGRPGYLWAFGAANIPYTYQMMKAWVTKERKPKQKDAEAIIILKDTVSLPKKVDQLIFSKK
jgi:hypothetical protein